MVGARGRVLAKVVAERGLLLGVCVPRRTHHLRELRRRVSTAQLEHKVVDATAAVGQRPGAKVRLQPPVVAREALGHGVTGARDDIRRVREGRRAAGSKDRRADVEPVPLRVVAGGAFADERGEEALEGLTEPDGLGPATAPVECRGATASRLGCVPLAPLFKVEDVVGASRRVAVLLLERARDIAEQGVADLLDPAQQQTVRWDL